MDSIVASIDDADRSWAGGGNDLGEIWDREEAAAAALVCPVCQVPYADPDDRLRSRTIQFLTDCDSWDTYGCPGCRPSGFVRSAQRYGAEPEWVQLLLKRAARDTAAHRRLSDEEHREAERSERLLQAAA